MPPLEVWVDCRAVIDSIARGQAYCCSSRNPAADLWRSFWAHYGDLGDEQVRFRWCKGHAREHHVQAGITTEWRKTINDHADHFATAGSAIAVAQAPHAAEVQAYTEARSWYRWLHKLAGHYPADLASDVPSSCGEHSGAAARAAPRCAPSRAMVPGRLWGAKVRAVWKGLSFHRALEALRPHALRRAPFRPRRGAGPAAARRRRAACGQRWADAACCGPAGLRAHAPRELRRGERSRCWGGAGATSSTLLMRCSLHRWAGCSASAAAGMPAAFGTAWGCARTSAGGPPRTASWWSCAGSGRASTP